MDWNPTRFTAEFINKIATDLVEKSIKVKSGEKVFLAYDFFASQLALKVVELILEKGASVDVEIKDSRMDNLIQAKSPIPALKQPDAHLLARVQRADCYLRISADEFTPEHEVTAERQRIISSNQSALRQEIVDEERTRRCVLYLPTYKQSEIDSMSFDEYTRMYFNACNLPWEKIKDAQEVLASLFNAGNKLEIEADTDHEDEKKRTKLSMDISGMTFANSHIQKNYPGAEVFSAPKLHSTEGTFFSPGRFLYHGKVLRDIFLRFEKGKVVDFDAAQGRDILEAALNTDDGSRYVGEIGIGTNPALTQDVSDGLLFEKKGGSFHLALGAPYHIRVYEGKPIQVDNGGDSMIHWDITQMLYKRTSSSMKLDGEIIQKDGFWLKPELQILNPKEN